jgi:predicted TIM-barrel fold metal-dependent hydrolase
MRGERLIFDADMHVQEPAGIWAEFLDPSLRSRVEVGTREMPMPTADGKPLLRMNVTRDHERRGRREMRPTQLVDRYGDLARRGFDAPALLEGMDVEGVDVAALFPSYGLYVPWADHLAPELAVGLAQAYNRWIVSLCAEGDRRLLPVALAPLHDPSAIGAEVRRAVTRDDVKAVMLRPNPVQGRVVSHPDHDRFFAEMVDLDIPVILHEGTNAVVAAAGGDRFDTWCGRHAASHPLEQMLALESLIFDGVLERHPNLRLGVFESGTGWLRWWLHRLDEHWEFLRGEPPQATRPPSEYFARQCVISTETDDPFVRDTVAAMGTDHVVWASDFPHPEAPWPHAVDGFLERGLAPSEEAAVFWSTPCALYRVDPTSLGRGRALPREPSLAATSGDGA